MEIKKGMHDFHQGKEWREGEIQGDCEPLPCFNHLSHGAIIVTNHHNYGSIQLMHPFESQSSDISSRSYGDVERESM